MLKFYIGVIELLFIFSFLFGINLSILSRNKNMARKASVISIGVISFLGLATTIAVRILKTKFPQKMVRYSLFYNRWTLSYSMIFLGISIVFLCLFYFYKRKKSNNSIMLFLYETFSFVGIWLLAFSIFPQFYGNAKEFIAFGETSFGTTSLLRVGGYILGIITVLLLLLSVYQVNVRLNVFKSKIFSLLVIGISLIDVSLRGVSALARLRILSARNPIVFEFMIWEDKSLGYIFGLFTIVMIVFSVSLFLSSRKVVGDFKNNATRRLERARLLKNRRWADSLIFFTIISLISVTIIRTELNRPVELSPPEEYITQGNMIIIPLESVDDGHLHRFSYMTEEGNNIRFIVVKKPKGGSYGVGLDACDICGVAGYFERNDEVVCKRCDVVMNKATIGFRGGCNPVPFEYEIKDKKIFIDKAVLEKEKNRFPVGE